MDASEYLRTTENLYTFVMQVCRISVSQLNTINFGLKLFKPTALYPPPLLWSMSSSNENVQDLKAHVTLYVGTIEKR